ncbi:MAG TPA: hypothetical protein VN898_10440, partial [Candidatus Binatia bacterium]|nr:hypothetical protein [Candidatus Binatia bacterium]
ARSGATSEAPSVAPTARAKSLRLTFIPIMVFSFRGSLAPRRVRRQFGVSRRLICNPEGYRRAI